MAWKNGIRNQDGFLFPVKAMAQVYKAIFIKGVRALVEQDKIRIQNKKETEALLQKIYQKDWVVYAKKPFAGPLQVIEYLARYTHKVAISNHRILSETKNTVTVQYKDYADKNKSKAMTLTKQEFIRRFEQHILPKHFCKIRTTGYLANRGRTQRIKTMCSLMKIPPPPPKIKIPWQLRLLEQFKIVYNECPCCKQNTLKLIAVTYNDDS